MMSRRTLSGIVLLLACLVSSVVVARTWTDTTGDFKVEAELLGVEGGLVRLKKKDGTVLSVPIGKLSTTDRIFLQGNQPTTTVAVAAPKKGSRDWPQWRGPARDGISPLTGLIDDWSASAPRLLWTATGMGKGYASVAISGGRIYTLGQHDGKEHLSAFKQEDGSHLWSTAVGSGDHSNGTPTVDGNLVYAVGLKGDLVCADAAGGKLAWKKNYGQDFGGRMMSGWGFSESPLVDGDRLICTPGSNQAMMAALDKKTGNLIWKTPFPQGGGSRGKDGAGYSSIVISKAGPVKQYVQLVGRGVIGVHAGDGSFLWGYDRIANGTANVPTPVVQGDLVFCSSGYGDGGSALLRMKATGNKVGPEEVYYRSASELQNHHGGMVQVGDYIYFGHGHNRGLPICVELATGKVMWGPVRGAGSGSAAIAFADGHLYFRYENGLMALIEATPEAYRLKGTFTIASRNGKSWPHPAIADGKLYLRDQDVLHCYSLTR